MDGFTLGEGWGVEAGLGVEGIEFVGVCNMGFITPCA